MQLGIEQRQNMCGGTDVALPSAEAVGSIAWLTGAFAGSAAMHALAFGLANFFIRPFRDGDKQVKLPLAAVIFQRRA